MTEEGRRPCPRCLAGDLPDGKALEALIRERVADIPPEERVTEEIRGRRLACCRACDALFSGTCAACGCYVEIRAARAGLGCPAVPPRWPAEM